MAEAPPPLGSPPIGGSGCFAKSDVSLAGVAVVPHEPGSQGVVECNIQLGLDDDDSSTEVDCGATNLAGHVRLIDPSGVVTGG